MILFITGTDTNIGKTLVASWLCLHTRYRYFKPIQTGAINETDSVTVSKLSKVKTYKETYVFMQPLSPDLAAKQENTSINTTRIILPKEKNLIIEGAGGLLVPLNKKLYMIDLIKQLNVMVVLVCGSQLGTINHTLLSLEALRKRNICIVGVIMSGSINKKNKNAVSRYGQVKILAELPLLKETSYHALKNIPLTESLRKLLDE